MRISQSEKMEIIRMVERSEVGATRTLREFGIRKSSFYNWYKRYRENGFDGLACSKRQQDRVWNKIPLQEKNRVVEIALEKSNLSSRELAWHITDQYQYYISESSVYRILKERGLITAPNYIVMSAGEEFKDKTNRPNEMWQTDFTYFKIIGWGWYYLSTVLDDYSRYIIAWDLCQSMCAGDARATVDRALIITGLGENQRPKLLSDNGPCYIANDLKEYFVKIGIKHIHGSPMHPQTQGKIERYHRSMKNVVKLENYYTPDSLRKAIAEFVHHYNHHRYHESLRNVTPADVFFGKDKRILQQRALIKRRTIERRRKLYLENKSLLN
jgi:transposase InsO family protein